MLREVLEVVHEAKSEKLTDLANGLIVVQYQVFVPDQQRSTVLAYTKARQSILDPTLRRDVPELGVGGMARQNDITAVSNNMDGLGARKILQHSFEGSDVSRRLFADSLLTRIEAALQERDEQLVGSVREAQVRQ